ncbi:MAG: hypothetical protein N4A45_10855 [Flavobacteriales bacterium]|jgi:hypothetical protein|nr:hypothetical protein [Flavobacteriales bacterium]
MRRKKNELKRVVFNLSQSKEFQIEYLNKLFNGLLHNLDELLLEFEDSRYLWKIYGDEIYELLTVDLCIVIDKADELGLHDLDDLSHITWGEVRRISGDILAKMILIDKDDLGSSKQDNSNNPSPPVPANFW